MDKLFYKFERAWESLVLEKFVKDDCNHVKDGERVECAGVEMGVGLEVWGNRRYIAEK